MIILTAAPEPEVVVPQSAAVLPLVTTSTALR
jgi:hypothetical protein